MANDLPDNDEVIRTLSNHGRDTISLSFCWKGGLYRWDPKHELVLAYSTSSSLAVACRQYLRFIGQYFDDFTLLTEWARLTNVPNLDGFFRMIENWKRTEKHRDAMLARRKWRQELQDATKITDEQIVELLTEGGMYPVELWFVLNGKVSRWIPVNRAILDFVPLSHAEDVACQQYLARHDRFFSTVQELIRHALQHDWPNFPHLLRTFESQIQREASNSQMRMSP